MQTSQELFLIVVMNVYRKRKELKINQKTIAYAIGCTRETYNKVEARTLFPGNWTLDRLCSLAGLLECEVSDLFKVDGEKNECQEESRSS